VYVDVWDASPLYGRRARLLAKFTNAWITSRRLGPMLVSVMWSCCWSKVTTSPITLMVVEGFFSTCGRGHPCRRGRLA
jgi:hypothetical protein